MSNCTLNIQHSSIYRVILFSSRKVTTMHASERIMCDDKTVMKRTEEEAVFSAVRLKEKTRRFVGTFLHSSISSMAQTGTRQAESASCLLASATISVRCVLWCCVLGLGLAGLITDGCPLTTTFRIHNPYCEVKRCQDGRALACAPRTQPRTQPRLLIVQRNT